MSGGEWKMILKKEMQTFETVFNIT